MHVWSPRVYEFGQEQPEVLEAFYLAVVIYKDVVIKLS